MPTPLVVQTSVQHYLDKGIAKEAAIGIVACLYYESKLSPGSQGSQSTETPGALNPAGAYGIASWNGPRQGALSDFAKAKGLDPSKLETQLDFVLTESANSYPKVWAKILDPVAYSAVIPVFVADYENPADHQKEIDAAMNYAAAWYLDLQSLKPSSAASPVVQAPAPVPVADLSEGQIAVIKALAEAIVTAQKSNVIQALAEAILHELS